MLVACDLRATSDVEHRTEPAVGCELHCVDVILRLRICGELRSRRFLGSRRRAGAAVLNQLPKLLLKSHAGEQRIDAALDLWRSELRIRGTRMNCCMLRRRGKSDEQACKPKSPPLIDFVPNCHSSLILVRQEANFLVCQYP